MDNIFQHAYGLMLNQDQQSLALSLDNTHQAGLFSLVIGGTEAGSLTRIFIACNEIKPFDLQLHSHTYNLELGVICGKFRHHEAIECSKWDSGAVKLKTHTYESKLLGGEGLVFDGYKYYQLKDYLIPTCGEISMSHNDIHTVSVDLHTMWIVREKGLLTNRSLVVGNLFDTEGLYAQPSQGRIDEMWDVTFAWLKHKLGK